MNNTKLKLSEWIELSLIVVFFGLFTLGQLQRLQLANGAALYIQDGIASLLLIWWSRDLLHTKISHFFNKAWFLLIGWIILGWLLTRLAHNPVNFALLYTARLAFYVVFAYLLAKRSWWPKLGTTPLKALLICTGVFIAYFGWLQYLLLPDLRFLGVLGWDTHFYRLVSTQFDPTFTGLLLVLTILVLQQTSLAKKWAGQLLQIALVMTIAFTYSRASYAALGVSQLIQAWHHRTQKITAVFSLGLVILLIISLPFLPRPGGEGVNLERTATGISRVTSSQAWLQSLTPLQWLTGRGLFVPLPAPAQTSPDDLVNHAQLPDNLEVLLTAGWGIGGWAIFMFAVYKTKVWQKLTPLETAALAAIFVHAQFNNSLFEIFIWIFLWCLIWSQRKYLKTRG